LVSKSKSARSPVDFSEGFSGTGLAGGVGLVVAVGLGAVVGAGGCGWALARSIAPKVKVATTKHEINLFTIVRKWGLNGLT
jgi:hypothetical protein